MLTFKLSISINPKLKEFLKISSYQIFGMLILSFNPLVDKAMASWLAPGSISVLEYANRIYQIPIILISTGFFTVLLSHWSETFYSQGEVVFKKKVIDVAKIVGLASVVCCVLLLLFSHPIVRLVYGHGKFPEQYFSTITNVLILYLLGLAPTVLGLVFTRAHLVFKNTKTLMILGAFNFFMNILFNFALIKPFGIYGLALSTAFTYSIITICLYITLVMGKIS